MNTTNLILFVVVMIAGVSSSAAVRQRSKLITPVSNATHVVSLQKIPKHDVDSAERSQTIKVYLVALDDNGKTGKKIGCDDSLVPVTRTIRRTATPLVSALRELLLSPQQTAGAPKLENFWKGRNLRVRSVSIRNHRATIHISGELFVAGICDIPRIESQIEETARQFPNVKRVKVFIGKRTLADAIR